MDVHDKLDDLSTLVENARAMPMSASCLVNRADLLDQLDEVRALLPEALAEADDVLTDRDEILEEARAEAVAILDRAEDQARELVSEHVIYQTALSEAEEISQASQAEAARMRRDIDDYVDTKLANFEVALHKTISAVQKGRDRIRGRHDFEDLGDPFDEGPFSG